MFLVVFQRSSVYFQRVIFTSHLDMLYKLFSDHSVYGGRHITGPLNSLLLRFIKTLWKLLCCTKDIGSILNINIYVKIVALLSDLVTLFRHFLFLSVSNLT